MTRPSREGGQAVIELALTLPLLLLVLTGIIDFGFQFQRYEVVTNAAREGARVGVLPEYGPTDASARALDYLLAGGIGGTSPRVRRGTGSEDEVRISGDRKHDYHRIRTAREDRAADKSNSRIRPPVHVRQSDHGVVRQLARHGAFAGSQLDAVRSELTGQ